MVGGIGGGATVRHPRCWVEIGGARIPCIAAGVRRSAKRGADTFSAQLSITRTEQAGFGLAEWTDFEPQEVSLIFASTIGGGDERVMMTGLVDEPQVRLAVVGSAGRGISAQGAYISLSGVNYALGCAGSGITAEPGGSIAIQPDGVLVALSNGGSGAFANSGTIHAPSSGPAPGSGWVYAFGNAGSGVAASNNGSATVGSATVCNLNGDSGFRGDTGGSIVASGTASSNNGASGYAANLGALINAVNTTGSGNAANGYTATSGAIILRTGGTTAGGGVAASPAVGTTGNGNAYIA